MRTYDLAAFGCIGLVVEMLLLCDNGLHCNNNMHVLSRTVLLSFFK